jgi:hypothetical protein
VAEQPHDPFGDVVKLAKEIDAELPEVADLGMYRLPQRHVVLTPQDPVGFVQGVPGAAEQAKRLWCRHGAVLQPVAQFE